jgi:hypothetical protein
MFNVRTHMSRGWISVVRGEAAAVVVEVDGEIADRYWRNRIMVTRTESVGQGRPRELEGNIIAGVCRNTEGRLYNNQDSRRWMA